MPPPVCQLQFAKEKLGRKWAADFAFPQMVICEVHGGVHVGGRHTTGPGFVNDREKMNTAQIMGYIVIEVTPEHIRSGQAIEWIQAALRLKGWKGND